MTLVELYENYMDELEEKYGVFSDMSAKDILTHYYDDCHVIYPVCDDGELVGFLIIGTAPDCHPACDYYICQTYVLPEHRRKGLMGRLVSEFLKAHPGKYCLDVIDGNSALCFWNKVFTENGFEETHFEDVPHGLSEREKTYYWW